MSPALSAQRTLSTDNIPIQKNTEGLIIEITIMNNKTVMDISSATGKKIIIKPPSGEKIIKDSNFTTDGKDGKIYCTTAINDLSFVGVYKIQGYIEMSGFKSFSTTTEFQVADNL
jgi:hypothetical protein